MKNIAVSIIICTCNRAAFLHPTLESLARLCVPEEMPIELLVADNGSTDDTAEVVQSCRLPNMEVRYLREKRRGQCYARNTGIAAARGKVILFTDDDVRPPREWIAGMSGPILDGTADAVAGGVRIAPHLERPWMTTQHRAWLAGTDDLDPAAPTRMVGANMAFGRHVLARVPAFDVELGPGALGFCDETLFSRQLRQAGYTIAGALDVAVEHHFDPARLSRSAFQSMADKQGRSLAYFAYHWEHMTMTVPRLRLEYARAKSACHGRLARGRQGEMEGMTSSEMARFQRIAFVKQYLAERRRPHQYEKFGLVKRLQTDGLLPPLSVARQA